MIRINTAQIEEEGLFLEGEEDSAILELEGSNDGAELEVLSNIEYKLHASMVEHDLLVNGSALVTLRTVCARCLKQITLQAGKKDVCIYREKVAEEIVDITDEIREDILLELPLRFLCSEDCKGLCACGADLNTEKCRCRREKEESSGEDHTWDALDGLKF
ncbi:MAG: DUF177 domain-containing protein [Lentisphaeria bacterium]|nr:DUF177 domain-containing protein [Lentisphaeria bacterium]